MTVAVDNRKRLADLQRLDYLLRFKWKCEYQDRGEPCPDNGKPHSGHPYKHARNSQIAPEGDWDTWFLMSGRGFGKTRTGGEFCKEFALSHPNSRIAIIAPDFAKGRDACVEGESGLHGLYDGQGCLPWEKIKNWNRSMGELYLTNGSQFKIFSADDIASADKLRGFQCHIAWFEELAAQKAQDHAWAMLDFALRLGDNPRTVITSTPLPTPLIKKLVKDPSVVVTTGSTYDNMDNLPAKTIKRLKKYEGTRLGRQELQGHLLLESSGAIWSLSLLEKAQITSPIQAILPTLVRIVIAVDPAGSHKAESDLTGIVVVGIDGEGFAYVLQDASGRYGPEQWAALVANLYEQYGADRVVAEKNYGGEMVKSTIRAYGSTNMPVTVVNTRVGKKRRAEPVAALYERGIVKHVSGLGILEEQMTTWVPPGRFDEDGEIIPASKDSPDRMDALVYGITELLLKAQAQRGGMRFYV